MLVREAKALAREWALEEASKISGFFGAYMIGSVLWKADDSELPPESNIDIKVVVEGDERPQTYTKSVYKGVLIEVSYALSKDYQSPETILSSYPFAKHFTAKNILADPSGKLTEVQAAVETDYTKRKWAQKRCEDALEWLHISLAWFNPDDALYWRFENWAYPFGVATHVLVMPDLRYPTVRQMFIASGEVLRKYGYGDFHEEMLTLFGSKNLSQEQVEELLVTCAETLDIAKTYAKTPFFGWTNISDQGRPTVVEGTQAMIDRGFHREAVLWIAWNHNWARRVIVYDAPADVLARAEPGFWRLLNALGIFSEDDLQAKHTALKAFAPRLWELTEEILAANPEVTD